jgi:hypothetical protein
MMAVIGSPYLSDHADCGAGMLMSNDDIRRSFSNVMTRLLIYQMHEGSAYQRNDGLFVDSIICLDSRECEGRDIVEKKTKMLMSSITHSP